jgi:hypothetical protein
VGDPWVIDVDSMLVEAYMVVMIENRRVDGLRPIDSDRAAAKGVGSKVDQGEECGSALLARIVFDKDNPNGRLPALLLSQ